MYLLTPVKVLPLPVEGRLLLIWLKIHDCAKKEQCKTVFPNEIATPTEKNVLPWALNIKRLMLLLPPAWSE